MRLEYDTDGTHSTRYTLSLSADETSAWANRPGASWPCSKCAGQRLTVYVDDNGLCDFKVNGARPEGVLSGDEVSAIIADHLPPILRHLWPAGYAAAK